MPFATNARDGSRVYFEDDGGDGTPIVILGGFLDPVELIRRAPIARALRKLGEEFRVVYADQRGHGRSDKPHDAAAYTMPLRVADAVAVLDALGIERSHFVGISWGGRLCFGIGEHAPERVRSLVIIGQQPYAIDADGPLTRVVGEALAASEERGIEALVEAFEAIVGRYPEPIRATYLACDVAAMRAAFKAGLQEGPVSKDLGRWEVPCLICWPQTTWTSSNRRGAPHGRSRERKFQPIEGEDHLGVDTAAVDPILAAVLRMLRG